MIPTMITQHFSLEELACPLTGECDMDPDFMDCLEKMRQSYGLPMIITSGFRSAEHNGKIGGATFSQHLFGRAVDIKCKSDSDRYKLVAAAIEAGMKGIGIYSQHVHVDLRAKNQRIIYIGKYK